MGKGLFALPAGAMLFIFLAAIAGAVGGWFFTFDIVVPWLEIPAEWAKVGGFLLFVFFFMEVGATVGIIAALITFAIGAVVLYCIGSAISSTRQRRRQKELERLKTEPSELEDS